MNSFDVIILILAIIILVVLISLNVGSIVEIKMKEQPNPNIIVKIQKSPNSEEYDVYVNNSKLKENFNALGPSQNLPPNPQVRAPVSVPQTLVSNSQPTVSNVNMAIQQPAQPTNVNSVQYPNLDGTVNYAQTCKGQIQNVMNNNIATPTNNVVLTPTCKNASLDHQRTDAYQYLIKNKEDSHLQACDNDHTDPDNITKVYGFDELTEIYRKNQFYARTYLEDPVLRGGNVDKYNDYGKLDDIGMISLAKDVPNARPSDYIFASSSVFMK